MYLKFLNIKGQWEHHGKFDSIKHKRTLKFKRDENGKLWFHERDRKVSYEDWEHADYHEDVGEDVVFALVICAEGGMQKTFIFAEQGYIIGDNGDTIEKI